VVKLPIGAEKPRGKKVKKSPEVLNVSGGDATYICGSGNPSPSAVSGASAHPPQAPIWLWPVRLSPRTGLPFRR